MPVDTEKIKQEFIEVYQSNIKREGADKLLEWLCDSDFFEAPASTKYHGSYPGGLAQHSLNVYRQLVSLLERGQQYGGKTDYSAESVAIAALLHDVCKAEFYEPEFRNVKTYDPSEVAEMKTKEPYTVKKDGGGEFFWKNVRQYKVNELLPLGHGEKSVIIVQQFMHLTLDEVYAIRAHMGGWDTSVKGGDRFIGEIFATSELALFTHIADMMANYLLENE